MPNGNNSIKKVVIAGCRDYTNYDEAKAFIDLCLSEIRKESDIVILSGGAGGADSLGERYAAENGFGLERYPAEWAIYGRGAGPKRNRKMAEECDLVICFWDGKSRGTKSMIDCATSCGKGLKIKDICEGEPI